jgi:GT2 family glycosyltransferase
MKKNKTDITVLIPIHELDESTQSLFEKAIKSVENQEMLPQKVMIIVPKGSYVIDLLKKMDYGDIKDIVEIVENDSGDTSFQAQINYGANKVETKYFTILEFDDEMGSIWLRNAHEYIEEKGNEVDVFLPIVIDTDKNNVFAGFTNEAVWVYGFSERMGYLDSEALDNYNSFSIDGMVIKTEVFNEVGGLKTKIKIYFIYEFLLRLAYLGHNIFVIPKFGYKHTNERENSLFYNYKKEIRPDEAKWWQSVAKREYMFKEDRDIPILEKVDDSE